MAKLFTRTTRSSSDVSGDDEEKDPPDNNTQPTGVTSFDPSGSITTIPSVLDNPDSSASGFADSLSGISSTDFNQRSDADIIGFGRSAFETDSILNDFGGISDRTADIGDETLNNLGGIFGHQGETLKNVDLSTALSDIGDVNVSASNVGTSALDFGRLGERTLSDAAAGATSSGDIGTQGQVSSALFNEVQNRLLNPDFQLTSAQDALLQDTLSQLQGVNAARGLGQATTAALTPAAIRELENFRQKDIENLLAGGQLGLETGVAQRGQSLEFTSGQTGQQQTAQTAADELALQQSLQNAANQLGISDLNLQAAIASQQGDISRAELDLAAQQANQDAFLGAGQLSADMAKAQADADISNIDQTLGLAEARGAQDLAIGNQILGQEEFAATNSLGQAQLESQNLQALLAAAIPSIVSQSGEVGSSSGGMSVLCTVVYKNGDMPDYIYKADVKYGEQLDTEILMGYHLWGKPLARLMRRNKFVYSILKPIVKLWAKEMAFRMKVISKGSLTGKLLNKIGIPICKFLGTTQRFKMSVPSIDNLKEVN